jgi:hypothetical protein
MLVEEDTSPHRVEEDVGEVMRRRPAIRRNLHGIGPGHHAMERVTRFVDGAGDFGFGGVRLAQPGTQIRQLPVGL